MVRSDRNWPDVYFGRPGALVKMPYPRGDMDKDFETMKYDFLTASGNHLVTTMLGGSRAYSMTWNALHVDTYSQISRYWLGQMGLGPWAFIDPSAPNLLLPNQAAACNYTYNTTGFTTNLGTLASNSNATQIHRTGAVRSLQWLWSTAPGATTPTLTIGVPYKNWYGIPVVPGLPYQWSGYVKPDGTVDTSITAAFKIRWLDATGANMTLLTSGDIPVTAWQQLSVGGVAPAGAAYAKLTVVVDGTSVLAGGSLYVDELQFEQDNVNNAWAPGTGLRAVEITSLNDPVVFNARFRKGVKMSLRELG